MNIFKKWNRFYKTLKLLYEANDTLIDIPKIKNLENVYKLFDATALDLVNSSTLDIGCGDKPRNPFRAQNTFGIDIRQNLNLGIKCADLSVEPIPFEDEKFDYITAYDFLEHIPRVIYSPDRRFAFVELMNEIYRTLKTGGIFLSHTPIHPFGGAYRDPTHVNILTDETFPRYFDDTHIWAKMYGFNGSFNIKYQGRNGMHLISIAQKT